MLDQDVARRNTIMETTTFKPYSYRPGLFFSVAWNWLLLPFQRFIGDVHRIRLAHMYADVEGRGRAVQKIICHPKDYQRFFLSLPNVIMEQTERVDPKVFNENPRHKFNLWGAEIWVDETHLRKRLTFVHN